MSGLCKLRVCLGLLALLGSAGCWPLPPIGPGPPAPLPPRETPGTFPGSSTRSSSYPAYVEPTVWRNAAGTPTKQQRLDVAGPDSFDNPWDYTLEGKLQSRPVLGPDGNLYFLAGTQMQVYSPQGKKQRSFGTGIEAIGGEKLLWGSAAGPLFRGTDGNLHCFSPQGEALWDYGNADCYIARFAPDGRLRVMRIAADGAISLGCLGSAGSELWLARLGNANTDRMLIGPDSRVVLYGGAENAHFNCIDANGETVWQLKPSEAVADLTLSPDGSFQIISYVTGSGGAKDLWVSAYLRRSFSAAGELLREELLWIEGLGLPLIDNRLNLPGGTGTRVLPPGPPLYAEPPVINYDNGDSSANLSLPGGVQVVVEELWLGWKQNGSLLWSFISGTGNLSPALFSSDGTGRLQSGRLQLNLDSAGQLASRRTLSAQAEGYSAADLLNDDGSAFLSLHPGVAKQDELGNFVRQWQPGSFGFPSALMQAADGALYVSTLSGYSSYQAPRIYCLSPEFAEYWHYIDEFDIRSAPTLLQNGSLVFGSEDYREHRIYVYSLPAPETRAADYVVEEDPYGWQKGSLKCLDRQGQLAWSLPLNSPLAAAPLAGDGGRVYWLEGSLAGEQYYMQPGVWPAALRCCSGAGAAQFSTSLSLRPVSLAGQLSNGTVLVATAETEQGGLPGSLHLLGFDPQSGAQLWDQKLGSAQLYGSVCDNSGQLYLLLNRFDGSGYGHFRAEIRDSGGLLVDSYDIGARDDYGGVSLSLNPGGVLVLTAGPDLHSFAP